MRLISTGEEMEDILEEIGLREQVISQVIDSEKYVACEKTWNDIMSNKAQDYSDFISYYTDNHLC